MFKSNIIQTIFRQAIGIVLGFATVTIIARILSPEGNGIYGTLVIFMGVLVIFLNFGLTSSNVYFISRRKSILSLATRASFFAWLSLTAVGSAIAFLIVYFGSERLFSGIPKNLLYLSILAFPILLFNSIMIGIFQAMEDFKRLNLITLLPIIINLLLLLMIYIFSDLNVASALACYAVSQFAATIAIVAAIKNRGYFTEGPMISAKQVIKHLRMTVKYSAITHASNVITYLNYRVDFYIVISILGPASAGIYFLAVQIVERLWIVAQSISYVMLPKLASAPKDEMAKKLSIKLATVSFLVTLILASVAAFASIKYLNIIFGENYARAISPILILLPGIILGSLSKIFSNVIAAYGEVKINLWVSMLLLTINIALSLCLTRSFGLIGAALATSISYSIDGIIKTILGLRVFRVASSSMYRVNTLKEHK